MAAPKGPQESRLPCSSHLKRFPENTAFPSASLQAHWTASHLLHAQPATLGPRIVVTHFQHRIKTPWQRSTARQRRSGKPRRRRRQQRPGAFPRQRQPLLPRHGSSRGSLGDKRRPLQLRAAAATAAPGRRRWSSRRLKRWSRPRQP